MKDLFIECPTGIASDMLLGALIDLGVPNNVVHESIESLKLTDEFNLNTQQAKSYGMRGLKLTIEGLSENLSLRRFTEIKDLINDSTLNSSVKRNSLAVFSELAEAEAVVHGCDLEQVHFHEVGSIYNLIKVVAICASIDYLKVHRIYCMSPPSGSGSVMTSHGLLPVPVPTVLEIAKRKNITLLGGNSYPNTELTTPTGISLISIFVDKFEQPSSLSVISIGVGLGVKDLNRPNILRVCAIESTELEDLNQKIDNPLLESLICQEAWIDDATSEDIAELIEDLRINGAIDVVSHSIQMKKGRIGVCIKALVKTNLAKELRLIWFAKFTTLGLREIPLRRWTLPRREGFCSTSIGEIAVKQVRRPDGRFTFKPEHKDLIRLSKKTGMSLDEIRQEVFSNLQNFTSDKNWHY
tara:strand:+ start:2320 stop:3552 length:1233 start_codon:yes stop_codon:yes gene_type:complete